MKLTSKNLEREILRRERSKGRDLNVTQVRTAIRHSLEIISEQKDEEVEKFVRARVKYYRKKNSK